jgi:hypothetical protein
MERILDWIRSFPRWLQYGFLSVIAAGIIYLVGYFIEPLKFIRGLVTAPIGLVVLQSLIRSLLTQPSRSQLNFLTIFSFTGYYFLIGALLGKITKKIVWAVIIWLAVFIVGYIIAIIGFIWYLSQINL